MVAIPPGMITDVSVPGGTCPADCCDPSRDDHGPERMAARSPGGPCCDPSRDDHGLVRGAVLRPHAGCDPSRDDHGQRLLARIPPVYPAVAIPPGMITDLTTSACWPSRKARCDPSRDDHGRGGRGPCRPGGSRCDPSRDDHGPQLHRRHLHGVDVVAIPPGMITDTMPM